MSYIKKLPRRIEDNSSGELILLLHDGYLDFQVAERPGGTSVEPAHLLVHTAPAVSDGRDKDIAGEQMAAAEPALAVAAVGVHRDGGALQRHGHGFTGGR